MPRWLVLPVLLDYRAPIDSVSQAAHDVHEGLIDGLDPGAVSPSQSNQENGAFTVIPINSLLQIKFQLQYVAMS